MKEKSIPELCRDCYWRLSGCVPEDGQKNCDWYTPVDLDEQADHEPAERDEYNAGPGAGSWGRAGFTVFGSLEEMCAHFRGSDD